MKGSHQLQAPSWWQAVYSTAARLVEPGVAKMRSELTVLVFSEFSINEQPQAFFKQEIGLFD